MEARTASETATSEASPRQVPDQDSPLLRALRRRAGFFLASGAIALILAGPAKAVADFAPFVLVVLGSGALIYYLVLRSRRRHEQRRIAEAAGAGLEKFSARSLAGVVVSRAILAFVLTMPHEPMLIHFTALLALVGLVAAPLTWRSRRVAAIGHLAKAGIYGIAALTATFQASLDSPNADLVVAKLGEYRQAHGRYPERVGMLVPAFLPAIPRTGMTSLRYLKPPGEDEFELIYFPSMYRRCFYRSGSSGWNCQTD